MYQKFRSATIFIAACALSIWANAHSGTDIGAHHGIGLVDGLLHPFTGLDHLAAMVAVGCWSALTARRIWLAPLAFAGMLLAGAVMGLAGVALPAVEPMIAASLLVLGLLLALRARLPSVAGAAVVGAFAIFHGLAHGTELSGAAHAWAPLAGMLVGTVSLHLLGIALGLMFQQQNPWWSRLAGLGVTVFGAGLLAQLL